MGRQQPTSTNRSTMRRYPLAVLVAALILPFAAHATDYTVTTGSDDLSGYTAGSSSCGSPCSLRGAIRAANAHAGLDNILLLDGINVNLSIAGIDENSAVSGDLDITDDLKITGQSTSGHNIINANGLDRVFQMLGNATVELQNLSIQNGAVTDAPGAGIYVSESATAVLNNVELKNNTVTSSGTAPAGSTQLQITGGGIHVDLQASAEINNSDIIQNQAPGNGGISNAGRTSIRGSVIDSNTATAPGGPGSNDLFSNGGGIGNIGGYLTIGNSTISNNISKNQGGGLYITNQGLNLGNVIITNCSITGNSSDFNGAGIANFGPAALNNSVVGGNTINGTTTTGGNGAGIYNHASNASMDIVNSTISGNSGANSGGGIFNSRDLSLSNVTIYDNKGLSCTTCGSANAALGGNEVTMYSTSASDNPNLAVTNTIIADGGTSSATEPACAGDTSFIESLGNSMSSDASCHLTSANDQKNVTTLGIDPTLAVDTNFTNTTAVHALLGGSPAIDNASNTTCPIVDQRFLLRTDNKCDIGAYEYGATIQQTANLVDLKITITDSPDPAPPNTAETPLTYVVTLTNQYVDNSATNVVLTIQLPTSYTFSKLTTASTGSTPSCSSKPNAQNALTCSIADLPGLARAEFFISGIPTQQGTITIRADAYNDVQDSFPRNNTNVTEDTIIDPNAAQVTNFNGQSTGVGGGGSMNPALLLLSGLVLLRRHKRD
jgi:hypothetical protein